LLTGHKREAVGYGSYDPYHGNNIGGMFNRRSGGWRSNSRFNGGWNQYGELFCDTICFQVYLIARRETEENEEKKMVNVCHQITTER
jgi:hypothetical protein